MNKVENVSGPHGVFQQLSFQSQVANVSASSFVLRSNECSMPSRRAPVALSLVFGDPGASIVF